MHQPRTDLGKAFPKGRKRRRPRSPETATATSNTPLDAIVRGLVSIGERLFKDPAQYRIP